MCQRKENWQGMNWIRQTTRLAIYMRDGLACAYCGATLEDGATLTLDHVKPASKGGTNDPSNLVTCCKQCNCSRGTRSMTAFVKAVAGYVRGKSAKQILTHVRNATRRALPRQEARDLIARRGSVAKALAA